MSYLGVFFNTLHRCYRAVFRLGSTGLGYLTCRPLCGSFLSRELPFVFKTKAFQHLNVAYTFKSAWDLPQAQPSSWSCRSVCVPAQAVLPVPLMWGKERLLSGFQVQQIKITRNVNVTLYKWLLAVTGLVVKSRIGYWKDTKVNANKKSSLDQCMFGHHLFLHYQSLDNQFHAKATIIQTLYYSAYCVRE